MPRQEAKNSYNGDDLCEMFKAGTQWLEKNAEQINALNVFPVPDGDTGINMLFTMRSTMEEANRVHDQGAGAVAHAMARGALMGARGNSGVILSQILRGLARGLESKKTFSGCDLADALVEASATAYKGVSRPVEGTILTVIREAATAAKKTCSEQDDVISVMRATVEEARESVARTPTLLDVLAEAGVVDAGGQGLYVILEGSLKYLDGEMKVTEHKRPETIAATAPTSPRERPLTTEGMRWGYCTEFLLEGNNLNVEEIRQKLTSMGDSALAVGDETTVRGHVHTFDPGAVLGYTTSLGILRQVKVENMEDQHQDFIVMQQPQHKAAVGVGTVVVASGDGITRVFTSLGAHRVVSGGQTMNPSTQELLEAVESLPSKEAIILPNNSNIVLTARQVQDLTQKKVVVVPAESIPQGIAALLAYNSGLDIEANAAAMEEARLNVKTLEITTAVRNAQLNSLCIKKGQAIGFLDGDLVAAADDMEQAVMDVMVKADVKEGGIVTVYYGIDTQQQEAEKMAEAIRRKYPEVDVEVISGEQPHYNYIISVE